MTFDLASLVPTQQVWLQTRAQFEGTARAEFTNPPGAIEGPATVYVNSAGRCRVRISSRRSMPPTRRTSHLGQEARRWERISSTELFQSFFNKREQRRCGGVVRFSEIGVDLSVGRLFRPENRDGYIGCVQHVAQA